jgi:RHH-type proline utilization regulon transcriptional repressor/proline dehydrogenase/delta 1-pyrroline-5-carboxylate dehydrogenase
LLCLQEDIADRTLDMIIGAARELKLGDPRQIATHVGPVIDVEAKAALEDWIARARDDGTGGRGFRLLFRAEADPPPGGAYVEPTIIALDRVGRLAREVFGPVLHVVRWRAEALDGLLDEIAGNGTALTLGVHSRIDQTVARIVTRLPHGNVYVNRNMIGAVVGTQPFGGTLQSGTGPKAGGPHYLQRFTAEQVVTVNTAAAGGNAGLLAEDA